MTRQGDRRRARVAGQRRRLIGPGAGRVDGSRAGRVRRWRAGWARRVGRIDLAVTSLACCWLIFRFVLFALRRSR